MPQDLETMLKQVPDEQRKVLERMMGLGLVQSFGTSDKGWAVIYTKKGRDFLDTVKAVAESDDEHRIARIVALEMLANSHGAFGGFA
jgi:hypothetical protein